MCNKDGVISLSLHPGIITTGINQNINNFLLSIIRIFCSYQLKALSQGAATTLICVTISDQEIYEQCGDDNITLYFDDTRIQNERVHSEIIYNKNSEIDVALWEYSKVIIGAFNGHQTQILLSPFSKGLSY